MFCCSCKVILLFSQHGYIVNELCDWKGVVYEMITAVLIFYIQNSTTLLCCVPFYYFLCSGEKKPTLHYARLLSQAFFSS